MSKKCKKSSLEELEQEDRWGDVEGVDSGSKEDVVNASFPIVAFFSKSPEGRKNRGRGDNGKKEKGEGDLGVVFH